MPAQTPGAGGPPWQRSNAATGPQPLAQAGMTHPAGVSAPAAVDWRVAALVGLPGALSLGLLAGATRALWKLRPT